ncbi:hypothetical protein CCACVL1_13541 [Corchorus capsularis]|uniref:Uncharacterized protein n=1 Tax=Corchorus capsularis TaxID=210143 RepID=A0A1R3IAR5_COCAP|nr:hypothetical protein CCACVL1_13541 [Corchorus capsularis]
MATFPRRPLPSLSLTLPTQPAPFVISPSLLPPAPGLAPPPIYHLPPFFPVIRIDPCRVTGVFHPNYPMLPPPIMPQPPINRPAPPNVGAAPPPGSPPAVLFPSSAATFGSGGVPTSDDEE